jgi:uncharacterized RDD family membrane protein YckC
MPHSEHATDVLRWLPVLRFGNDAGDDRPVKDARAAESMAACGLPRRLGAMLYDSLLVQAVLFMATLALMPFTEGEAVPSANHVYPAYLLFVAYIYFTGQWVRGGQTLGMRAWRIRLATMDGAAPGWLSCSLRFAASILCWLPLGLGFLSGLVRTDRLAWNDRLSRTRLAVE